MLPDATHGGTSALFTDLYELTMAQAYLAEDMTQTASFELFFRKLPASRRWMLAAGLDDVLTWLEGARFSAEDIDYLRQHGEFSSRFLDRLASWRFRGDVDAVPEGTPVLPNEPLVRVTAPIIDAQLVETFVLNQVHFQTVVATKAAIVVDAAQDRKVVDFGSRRAHGADAAMKVARCSYLAGAAGTSNVLAGRRYGIPVFGTMAHSYIQAHDAEAEAFRAFAEQYDDTTLLVDTYDTLDGVQKVIDLRNAMGDAFNIRAIRLDSGDLGELARQSRRLLDSASLDEIDIFASSGLDEDKIADLLADEAPIDGFGVGTKMAVSRDAPDVDMAYKLVEYAGQPRIKLSTDKTLYPGRKQVFREDDRDTIACHDESLAGQPLLRSVMRDGRRTPEGRESLSSARQRVGDLRQSFRWPYHAATGNTQPSASISEALQSKLRTTAASPGEQTMQEVGAR